jgi:hypothetical protein
MTLKVAVDNTNVEAFPALNLQDIAACARKFADAVEAGDFGPIASAMLVLDTEDGMDTLHWGESMNIREAIGTFDIAKSYFIAKVIGEQE